MITRRARYARIRELTQSLLDRFGVREPAVPVLNMLRGSGIDVRQGDLGEVSGLIARQGSATVVGINAGQSLTRQRFTMAHEFGHFLLHQDLTSHRDLDFRVKYRDRTSSEATDVEEIEANFFAASLLMPRPFLDAYEAWEALDSDGRVADLARVFDVSPLAMSLRLSNEYASHRPF